MTETREIIATDNTGLVVTREIIADGEGIQQCAQRGAWTWQRYMRNDGVRAVPACDLRCAERRWRYEARR